MVSSSTASTMETQTPAPVLRSMALRQWHCNASSRNSSSHLFQGEQRGNCVWSARFRLFQDLMRVARQTRSGSRPPADGR